MISLAVGAAGWLGVSSPGDYAAIKFPPLPRHDLFGTVVPFFLFRIDHASFSRFNDEPILGNWDVFLNVLNVETEDGATGAHLRRVLFGEPEAAPYPRYDEVMGRLYGQVLRPLCWSGLLQQDQGKRSYRTEEAVFMKTPLWRAALRLETDRMVRKAVRH